MDKATVNGDYGTVTAQLIDDGDYGDEVRRVEINGRLSFPDEKTFDFLLNNSTLLSDKAQDDVAGELRVRTVEIGGRAYQDYVNKLVESFKADTPKTSYR